MRCASTSTSGVWVLADARYGRHARAREVRIKYGGEATTRKLLYACTGCW